MTLVFVQPTQPEESIMNGSEELTKLIEGSRGASHRPLRILAVLSIVVVIAAACSSDATTASAGDAAIDEQVSVTTAAPDVESTTTTEPEPEPEIESEPNPAPDATVVAFTEAFGVADADTAFGFMSERCAGAFEDSLPPGYADFVTSWAGDAPGATAVVTSADVDGDRARISYEVHNGSGEFFERYTQQPWVFEGGQWHSDHC